MEYFEEDIEQTPVVDAGPSLALALSTTLLGVVFVLLLIGDQVAAGF
jgi:hypothetical protein